MKEKDQYLNEGNKKSMMRLVLFQIWSVFKFIFIFMTVIIGFHITFTTIKGGEINWYGIAGIFAGLSSILWPPITGKFQQKKYERNYHADRESNDIGSL